MTYEGSEPQEPDDELGELQAAWDYNAPFNPPVVPGLGEDLGVLLRLELHIFLLKSSGQLARVYLGKALTPDAGAADLLDFVGAANSGVIGNRLVVINAIMNGRMPKGPSLARQAASTVRTLLKTTVDEEIAEHLASVLANLESVAGDVAAVDAEAVQLQADSVTLQTTLQTASGVYVYTYPHYWLHPYVAGTERRLLKVGRTTNQAWSRVLSQARQTGMPEEPVLLRVYEASDPVDAEHKFHVLLDAAEHHRSEGVAVGKEWFATTIEFCDAIAGVLLFNILKGSLGQ